MNEMRVSLMKCDRSQVDERDYCVLMNEVWLF